MHPAYYALLDPNYMIQAKQNDLEVNAWTINEEEYMDLACQMGISGIITNYPDKALAVVEKYK